MLSDTSNLYKLLTYCLGHKASDLHLMAGVAPRLRLNGQLRPLELPPLTPEELESMASEVLDDLHREKLSLYGSTDFALSLGSQSERFRVSLYRRSGTLSFSFRAIPHLIPPWSELGLPQGIGQVLNLHRGLVLITGATGSGKSTTLAALVHALNSSRSSHILTLEDPIEFTHSSQSCLVSQRELGRDFQTFPQAISAAMRQDPDIIMLGEMRDPETMGAALTLAETGHLVLATLHTNSAPSTISRIIDAFPAGQQAQIRAQLAYNLQMVLSQQLLPSQKGGRVVACEFMWLTPALRNLIREDKIHLLAQTLQSAGDPNLGMTLNSSLLQLVRQGHITGEKAVELSSEPQELKLLMTGQMPWQKR